MRGLAVAVAFLTRIPIPVRAQAPADLARAVPWFPVVGAIVGAVSGTVVMAASAWLPPLIAGALGTGLGLLVTGAFHEDGLADTFDALGGAWDRVRALEILADSRIGTFGAAALLVALAVRIGSYAALGLAVVPAAAAAGAAGRAVVVAIMMTVPPAVEGLGAEYVRALERVPTAVGVAVGVTLAGVLLGWTAVPALVAAVVAGAAVAGWAKRRIGGVTGDVLGACQVVAELAVLVASVAAAGRGSLPW